MKKYFEGCRTAEELKKEYRKQAAKLHPDCNPGKDTTAAFQEMQAEFEKAWETLKNIHVNADGERYEKETTETAAEFMDIINALLKLNGLEVEMIGSWIWVTGNTKEHKDTLKEMGFKWSPKKCAWSFHFGPWVKFTKRNQSLNELRFKYGSTVFVPGENEPAPVF